MSISQTAAPPVPSHSFLKAARKVAASAVVIMTTLLGLLIITFVVGRMVPADPVIAAIGDQADRKPGGEAGRTVRGGMPGRIAANPLDRLPSA